MRKATAVEKQVKKIELQIYRQKEKLARLRKKVKLVEVDNYKLQTMNGKSTTLSDLFGKKDELILVHNMGTGCPYCTMWADGFNGELHHIQNRAAFALESPNAPAAQKRFAKSRGWRFPMVSSRESQFRREMGFVTRDGDPIPGVSTFRKKNGKIYLASQSVFGPGDNFCSVWDLFDLLPKGVNGWEAKFRY